ALAPAEERVAILHHVARDRLRAGRFALALAILGLQREHEFPPHEVARAGVLLERVDRRRARGREGLLGQRAAFAVTHLLSRFVFADLDDFFPQPAILWPLGRFGYSPARLGQLGDDRGAIDRGPHADRHLPVIRLFRLQNLVALDQVRGLWDDV